MSNEALNLSVGTIETQNLSTPLPEVDVNANMIARIVEYSADYKGPKYHKDGQTIYITKESAEAMEKAGMLKVETPAEVVSQAGQKSAEKNQSENQKQAETNTANNQSTENSNKPEGGEKNQSNKNKQS